MNGLNDSLYERDSDTNSTKKLWKALNQKYKTEDASFKKFVVNHFLDYEMVNSKSNVLVLEFQLIIREIQAEKIELNKSFQVTCVIEKLLLALKDFKKYLKYKQNEIRMEDLIVRLRIEEGITVVRQFCYKGERGLEQSQPLQFHNNIMFIYVFLSLLITIHTKI